MLTKSCGGSDDETNKITVCSFHHGLMHDVKRYSLSTLTKQGLKKARDKGVSLGRPTGKQKVRKLDSKNMEITALLDKGVSVRSIAKIIGAPHSTLNSHISDRGYPIKQNL